MSLATSFTFLKKAVLKYRDYVVKPRLLNHDSVATEFVDRIVVFLNAFNVALRRQPEPSREEFWTKNVANVSVIHDTLVGKFAKTFTIRADIDKLRTAINQMFGLFHKRPSFSFLPTILFNEFCKGITYFQNEVVIERPSYHRDASCGESDKTAMDKFTILATDAPGEAIRKKTAVRLCYIERLVYDALYSKILYAQDLSHLFEKQIMDHLHLHYFPNETISIEITYDCVILPVALTVKTMNHNGLPTIEKFTKPWTSSIVRCEKTEAGKLYVKTQSFVQEEAWTFLNLYRVG